MGSVAVLSGNHLCHNPRVIKEAAALSGAGHDVTVLGAWFDWSLKKRDQELLGNSAFKFVPVFDRTESGLAGSLGRFQVRARVKAAQIALQVLDVESPSLLGYAATALREAALRTRADLYIAHSEAGLAAAVALLAQRRRIGVDMEDWFSEDLLPESRGARPLRMLRGMEQTLLRHSAHSTCPSRAMSEALAREYGSRPPVVVYNAFPWADRTRLDGRRVDRLDLDLPSLHWVSQTLGPGRGLDDLLGALPLLKRPAQLHLRGRQIPGFAQRIRERLPADWRARIFMHELVTNEELLSRIAEHDVGFAGEERYCRSRDLTVTNKILHYLGAGLAVVASETAGQSEVAALAPGAVLLYPPGDSKALAARIDQLLGDPASLAAAKQAALAAAERALCWEKQVGALIKSAEDAIAGTPDH